MTSIKRCIARASALFIGLSSAGQAASPAASMSQTGSTDAISPYEAAAIGAGYAAGDAIGAAAVGRKAGGYDGGTAGAPSGRGPADRPCFERRPVYNSEGTMIGYRGQQLC